MYFTNLFITNHYTVKLVHIKYVRKDIIYTNTATFNGAYKKSFLILL